AAQAPARRPPRSGAREAPARPRGGRVGGADGAPAPLLPAGWPRGVERCADRGAAPALGARRCDAGDAIRAAFWGGRSARADARAAAERAAAAAGVQAAG